MGNGSRFTLAAGLLALVAGRALLALAPETAGAPLEPWKVPDQLKPVPGQHYTALSIRAPATDSTQTATLQQGAMLLDFNRFHYTTSRIDADLVPWFPELYDRRWIKLSNRMVGEEPRVNLLKLEHVSTGERQVLAWVMRVGPYAVGRFTKAKLLQIPAKLQRNAVFEILTLSTECQSDCSEEAPAVAEAMRSIVELNLR